MSPEKPKIGRFHNTSMDYFIQCIYIFSFIISGPFPAIFGKGPWPKLGKKDRLNIKIGRN